MFGRTLRLSEKLQTAGQEVFRDFYHVRTDGASEAKKFEQTEAKVWTCLDGRGVLSEATSDGAFGRTACSDALF